jgi:radical SAM protein with 4Fe4S-binding SPASM domain
MSTALAALRPPAGLRIMQSWHPRNANCCWQMSAINAFGDSIGCAYLREYVNFGNVLREPFLHTWNHPLGQQLRSGRVERSCGSCATSEGSHGGCRATAYAFHGRFDAPDPFDLELNDGIDLRVLPDPTAGAQK